MDIDRRLRLTAEQDQDHAILLMDSEARLQWLNPAAENIFGLTSAQAAGRPVASLFTEDDLERGLAAHELDTARRQGTSENDRWLVRADGSRFWANGITVCLRDDREKVIGFGKVLRNRTDLREQIDTLRNVARAAEEANARKDVFLSTLSHELRNPLAPLTNAVYLIRLVAPALPELEAPLRIIERQLSNLGRLVDDLMDLSRIGAGKVDLRKEKVALQDVIHRAVESVQPQVRDRGHKLEVLLPGQPIVLDADPVRLEQVFVNLLNNSIKYSQRGGQIWVKCTGEDEEVVTRIEDNGVGIPQDMLPRIFDLFTQVDASKRQAEGGLGIGLSLVKKLVSLHGGTVQVSSEGPGKGSEFTVRLPLRPEKEVPDQEPSSSEGLRSRVSIADPASAQRH